MRRTGRIFLFLTLLLALCAADVTPAAACSCVGNHSLLSVLASAEAVFAGTVTKMDSPLVTVAVSQRWKGPSNATLTVSNPPVCAYPFEVGKDYLIFAVEDDGLLQVSICQGIRPLAEASAAIVQLNSIFSPHPLLPASSSAVVTVLGQSRYPTRADLLIVRFLLAEADQGDAPSELLKNRLAETLIANRVPEALLAPETFYGDHWGFYLIVPQAQIPNANTAAFLQSMRQAELELANDAHLPIHTVEVLFTVQDCLQVVVDAQRKALLHARERAELLANLMGSRLGEMIALSDESVPPEPAEGDLLLCEVIQPHRWHPLPLETDLERAQLLRPQIRLRVSYALEKAVSGVQPSPEQ
jgi:hypothetical protein